MKLLLALALGLSLSSCMVTRVESEILKVVEVKEYGDVFIYTVKCVAYPDSEKSLSVDEVLVRGFRFKSIEVYEVGDYLGISKLD